MDRKFDFSLWSFWSMAAGFLLGGGMALAEGANLWPLTAILGGVVGLLIGAVLGVVLKLFKVPMKYAWGVFGIVVSLAFCTSIYIRFFYEIGYGKIVEGSIVECTISSHVFTPIYRNVKEDWKELGGIDLTLNVARERRLARFQDRRIKVYEWKSADYTKTYFMAESSCESLIPDKTIALRAKGYGKVNEHVQRIRWNPDTVARDGRFVIDR